MDNTQRDNLAMACATHAAKLIKTMREHGIQELQTPFGTLVTARKRSNISYEDILYWDWDDCACDLSDNRTSERRGEGGYYLHNDFHCWINFATFPMFLFYAESRKAIDAALAKAVEDLDARCEAALALMETK